MSDDTEAKYARWLTEYTARARTAQSELGGLFEEAFAREKRGQILRHMGETSALRFIRRRRGSLSHPIVLFIYSSRFDAKVAGKLLDPEVTKAALPEGMSEKDLFEHKAASLEPALLGLAYCADTAAAHCVAALITSDKLPELPLMWQAPWEDEEKTGYSPDAPWWLIFQYLCEAARAIVAYGGLTEHLFRELRYVRTTPRLRHRLVWLDADFKLYFPDRDEEQWPLARISAVLRQIEATAQRRRERRRE